MTKNLRKTGGIALVLLGFLFAWQPVDAQLGEIRAFLESGEANANKLAQAYTSPLPTGLSTALNSGWTTGAAPTKKLGFSAQFRLAFAAVPSSGTTFDARTLDLEDAVVTGESSNTIAGGSGDGQRISDLSNSYSFTLPGGTGVDIVPAAMIQGNVGLIKGTDITVRYIPETDIGDYGSISVIGAGIKHGLNQWLPGGKLLPVDLSIMAAFSQTDLNATISSSAEQFVNTTTDTFVFNALVGKKLPFISAYAGVGFQTGSFSLEMLGDYDVDGNGTTDFTDPVSFTSDSDAAIHALAGAQFKLAIFRIYAEVTVAEYTTYNAGIGIGLR